MSYWKRLAVVEMRALATLTVISTVVAGLAATVYLFNPDMRPSAAPLAAIFFVTTFVIGAIVIVPICAPLYLALRDHGRASWGAVSTLSAAPGVAFALAAYVLNPSEGGFAQFGAILVACGLGVGLATHMWFHREATRTHEP